SRQLLFIAFFSDSTHLYTGHSLTISAGTQPGHLMPIEQAYIVSAHHPLADLPFQPGSALAIGTDATLEPNFPRTKLIPAEIGTHIKFRGPTLKEGWKEIREQALDHGSTLAQEPVALPSLGHAFARFHSCEPIAFNDGNPLEMFGE